MSKDLTRKTRLELRLKLNKYLYSEEALQRTVRAYGAVCTVQVQEEDTHYIVVLKDHKMGEGLALEFSNHALAMMRNAKT